MNFQNKFDAIVKKNNSLVCVGLDPEPEKIPTHVVNAKNPLFEFNKHIVDATADLVCAYKPNIAFYEARGLEGLAQLKKTIAYIQKKYPYVPIILDAKRADIGNTSRMYAKAIFDHWQADAVTVFGYLGLDSLVPFFQYSDKLVIVLVHTSNPDAIMFQELNVSGKPYYVRMAEEMKRWKYANMGILIGATYPDELALIRALFPENIFLSAGIGKQHAEIEKAVRAGINAHGKGIAFNASRSILYASGGRDFAQKAREETLKLKDAINIYRTRQK